MCQKSEKNYKFQTNFGQCAKCSVKSEILISLLFENPIARVLNYAQSTKI